MIMIITLKDVIVYHPVAISHVLSRFVCGSDRAQCYLLSTTHIYYALLVLVAARDMPTYKHVLLLEESLGIKYGAPMRAMYIYI